MIYTPKTHDLVPSKSRAFPKPFHGRTDKGCSPRRSPRLFGSSRAQEALRFSGTLGSWNPRSLPGACHGKRLSEQLAENMWNLRRSAPGAQKNNLVASRLLLQSLGWRCERNQSVGGNHTFCWWLPAIRFPSFLAL